MGIKAPETTPRVKTKRVEQPEFEATNYPCRVAQVIDMGLQHKSEWDDTARKFFPAVDKAPVHMIMLTYEFVTEFMKDEDGNDVEDKPRWLSEDFPIYALDSDLATSTKRMKAFDPTFSKFKGDFVALAGEACTVTIGHRKGGKSKIGNVSPPMKGFPVPELKNPIKVFTLDEPDVEIFKSLPTWLQEKIQGNLEYEGSPLQALVGDAPVKTQDDKPKQEKPPVDVPVDDSTDEDGLPW